MGANKKMFLFKRKCKHEYETLGMFYKEIFTEYRNCFDAIVVYRRERCKKCGDINDVYISSKNFPPELYYKDYTREQKDKYIEHLTRKDIGLEIDL